MAGCDSYCAPVKDGAHILPQFVLQEAQGVGRQVYPRRHYRQQCQLKQPLAP